MDLTYIAKESLGSVIDLFSSINADEEINIKQVERDFLILEKPRVCFIKASFKSSFVRENRLYHKKHDKECLNPKENT